MRAGGSSVVQQSLTPDASAMVKHAVSLARRRGHAQVTPLHVASAMLSIPAGLLRSACVESHAQTHPLRCKALDLCFNVALNRLPSSSQILMGSYRAHHQSPSLSNALVAAFKRAQAHQRRGSAVDAQQQAMVTVRIDIEQLIISILDDPSVSRVMREAGFSSTQVKANVEKAVSLELASPPNPNPNPTPNIKNVHLMTVVEALMTKQKRSIVIIGDCLNSSDGVVRSLMDGVKKGEVVKDLRSLQFITLSLLSFEKMSKEEVEEKVAELRCVVRSCRIGRGVVLYLGDLKWAADHWASCKERGEGLYCAIERVVKEIAMFVNSDGDDLWLMAIATEQTYSSCRVGNPSLETIWGLQPLTIPAVSLDLSLNNDSNLHSQLGSKRSNEDRPCWPLLEDGVRKGLTSSSVLPLQQYNRQDSRRATVNNLVSLHVNDQNKWNSTLNSHCRQQHTSLQQTLNFSSVSISASSPSTSSTETIEVQYLPRFKELNAENLKTLCNSLEKLSCQKDIIPNILASIILKCRSGMLKRKEWSISPKIKEETWLGFLGTNAEAKEKIARGLAALIFGSQANFISIGLSEFSSSSDRGSKRSRVEASHGFLERLASAIQDNPHRVILLKDVEQIDYESQTGILDAIRRGIMQNSDGENVSVSDAIIILSSESSSFGSRSRVCSPRVKQKLNSDEEKERARDEGMMSSSAGFDLNVDAECGDVDLPIDELGLLEAVDSTFVFN